MIASDDLVEQKQSTTTRPSTSSRLSNNHRPPMTVTVASSTAAAASTPSRAISSPPPSLAHLYTPTATHSPSTHGLRPPVVVPMPPMTPEQRARQLIHAALREAASGAKPLQHVSVLSFRIHGDLVLYEILVQGSNNLRWLLTRRFAEFADLNQKLENSVRNVEALPPFPSKEWRILVDHHSFEFLSQRLALLDNYLRKILAMPKLRGSSSFLEFLRPTKEELMDEDSGSTTTISPTNNGHSNSSSSNGKPSIGRLNSKSKSLYIAGSDDISSSGSPQSRASLVTSASMNEELFEPRSFEDEQKSERRERIESLVAAQQAQADGSAVEIREDSPFSANSVSSHNSRRTSHSQVYEPHPTQVSFMPPSIGSSTNYPNSPPPASSFSLQPTHDSPLWLSPEVSDVSIPAAQILKNDHVVFQLNVENIAKLSAFSKWTVLKRFVEFYRLDQAIREALQSQHPNSDQSSMESSPTAAAIITRLPLLPKRQSKVLVDHLQARFIEKRRLLLEVYMKKLITIPEVCTLDCVLDFLGCN